MMKVPPALRTQFQVQETRNQELKERAESILSGFKLPHWHYEGRLKNLESFALKVESGRVPDPSALEDFFACTLVVRNASEIPTAERLVRERFNVLGRRPADAAKTHKPPDQFLFDDLRLYVTLKTSPALPPTDLESVRFEVQVKTFLQHAWSIATHDMIYKSNEVHWSKARIAFQIKAMLEHAELAIEEAENLAQGQLVAKTDRHTRELSEIIDVLASHWPRERLPSDLKRLAENVQKICRCLNFRISGLKALIEAENAAGRGVRLLDRSPYAAIAQGLVLQESDKFAAFVAGGSRDTLMVPRDIEVPVGLAWPPVSERIIAV